ncbi:MAG: hypothetical protein R3C69_15140 [Geminicoccaceae bacterium]
MPRRTAAALLAKAKGQDALAGRSLRQPSRGGGRSGGPRRPARPDQAFLQAAPEAAAAPLAALAGLLRATTARRAAVRHALLGLDAYRVAVPEAAIQAFPPPRLVIYCGARDPALAGEPAVAAAIRDALAAVEAEIVYGSGIGRRRPAVRRSGAGPGGGGQSRPALRRRRLPAKAGGAGRRSLDRALRPGDARQPPRWSASPKTATGSTMWSSASATG